MSIVASFLSGRFATAEECSRNCAAVTTRVRRAWYHRSPVSAEPTASSGSPLDPERAEAAIEAADDRQQVFDLLLRATRSRARFAALLSVHTDHIRGRSALADAGIDCRGVDTLRIPRNAVAAFEEAIASGSPSVGPLVTGEPFI